MYRCITRLYDGKTLVADHLCRSSLLFRSSEGTNSYEENHKKRRTLRVERDLKCVWLSHHSHYPPLELLKIEKQKFSKSRSSRQNKIFRNKCIMKYTIEKNLFSQRNSQIFIIFRPRSSVEEQQPSKLKVTGSIPVAGTIWIKKLHPKRWSFR